MQNKSLFFRRQSIIKTVAIIFALNSNLPLPSVSIQQKTVGLPFAAAYTYNEDNKKDKDWREKLAENSAKAKEPINDLSNFAKKTLEELTGAAKGIGIGIGGIDGENIIREAFEKGIPGQVGYGFLMGYSSGFCLKKV